VEICYECGDEPSCSIELVTVGQFAYVNIWVKSLQLQNITHLLLPHASGMYLPNHYIWFNWHNIKTN
jgi:hypothetical protein